MSRAADEQDGNGLQYEKKMGQIFQVKSLYLGKLAETHIMVDPLFESLLDIFLLLFYKHLVCDVGT